MCPGEMCILLYLKLIQCSGIPYIYGQLEEEDLGICVFCYMWNWSGVVVFYTSMINWRGVSSSDGYRSSENVMMSRWPYVVLLLATRCLYVKLMQCSGTPEIYGEMGVTFALGRCPFSYMSNLCSVVVFIDLWSIGGGGPWYMCILLCEILIWCSGIPEIYGHLEEGEVRI